MVDAVIGVLLQNLNSLIQREVVSLWGVEDDIRKLSSILSTVRATLEDAEIKQIGDKSIADWLIKLKNTAYDASDVLDEWMMDDRNGKSVLSCMQINFRHPVAKRIKKIIIILEEIAEERCKFHLTPVVVQQTGFYLDESRETSSILAEDVVYGREVDKEKIVDVLLRNVDREQDVSILSILGIGGLGKTTLAQLVYHDRRIVEHFDTRIWVCVSDNFELKRLTKMIVESLTSQSCDLKDLDPMQRQLQENLSGKRFLLILDDVWNEDPQKWRKLKSSLTCGGEGSTIIITTRLATVTSMVGSLPPHHLTFLSQEECWSLFKGCAFGLGNEDIADLVEIGKEIVRKCGGVPLAVKTLGGLMSSTREVNEWLYVRDSEIWELPQDKTSGILPALRLSYNHLPAIYKRCFAFCSIYPKDHEMDREELIHLWMANSYLQPNGRMELEDSGNHIFNELLRRSFFQDIQEDSVRNTKIYKMHALIHDLACLVSVNEFEVVEVGKADTFRDGIRHRSLVFDSLAATKSSNLQNVMKSKPALRSLLLLGNYRKFIESQQIAFRNLGCLRALDLSRTKTETLPDVIGKMIQLRYLNLSKTPIKSLPESICKLRSLQTLKLRKCKYLRKLPKHTSKMSSLRHLNIKGCKRLSEMPLGLGELTKIQTLSKYIIGPENGRRIKELQELHNLRGEVKLKSLEHVRSSEEAEAANLLRKKHISSLRLSWSMEDDDAQELQEKVIEGLHPHPSLKALSIKGYLGTTLPSWMALLQNLVKISLEYCFMCEHLPPLGQLPLLKVLSISRMPFVKCIGHDFYGEVGSLQVFPSLEEFSIKFMNGLKEWLPWPSSVENSREALPSLKRLNISGCYKLRGFPFLPRLEYIKLWHCNKMILKSSVNLPRLHTLEIWGFKKMMFLPKGIFINSNALQSLDISYCDILKSLPEDIENLTALTSLKIMDCGELLSLPEGLKKLTNLKELRIWSCDRIKFLPLIGMTQGLNISLVELVIDSCANLVSLSDGLRFQTSLERLYISSCPEVIFSEEDFLHLTSLRGLAIEKLPKLTALPKGIQHLTVLQHLKIWRCENLRMLPVWLQCLSTLQSLWIKDCHPDLHIRCEKGRGKDWHKISHIPKLFIDESSTSSEESSA